jgi:hypothetical protein
MRQLNLRRLLFLVVVAGIALFSQAREAAAQPASGFAAIYYAASGDVVLDITRGGYLNNLHITGPGTPFDPNADHLHGYYEATAPNELDWFFFTPIPTGLTLSGILPPSLSSSQLIEQYEIQIAHEEFVPLPWEYIAVPEPGAPLLATVAVVFRLFIGRRRATFTR